MRILLGIDSLGVGGKERQSVELIKGLTSVSEVDCRVVCFGPEDFYLNDLDKAGIRVDFMVREVRWDLRVFEKLHRLFTSHRPNVVHTNGLVSSAYCLPLAKRCHIPVINGSIRNAFTSGGTRWALERLLLKASDYRVANSRAGLRSRNFSEEDPRNVVIYNGFDFARVAHLNADALDAKPSLSSGRCTVGMVAEFNPYKDYPTFIEAARILSRRKPDVTFVAVGDGNTLIECKAAAAGLKNVVFLGKRTDVEKVVMTFDIGVLCTFVEGLSNSIMEYMALGKPVVATDGGGTRELVVDGKTGFLVKPSDAQALATVIEHLIDHPDVAARIGSEGQARLRRDFTLERMVHDTITVYRRAAGSWRGAAPGIRVAAS
jgi:glycosyltransferase involved in cell wall biosynthesis